MPWVLFNVELKLKFNDCVSIILRFKLSWVPMGCCVESFPCVEPFPCVYPVIGLDWDWDWDWEGGGIDVAVVVVVVVVVVAGSLLGN